jgi:hypothetical protein
MNSAIVIGNGESRTAVDFTNRTNLIGCNAIHRDMIVPFLVCCDRRMVYEALKNPNSPNTKIYTRSQWREEFTAYPNVFTIDQLPYQGINREDDIWHWGSGPLALLLACQLDFDCISVVGFDLHGNNSHVNNVYKGTENYLKIGSAAVDPSYWIYQVSMVFKHHPTKYFMVYNNADWSLPDSWKLANVEFKTLDKF